MKTKEESGLGVDWVVPMTAFDGPGEEYTIEIELGPKTFLQVNFRQESGELRVRIDRSYQKIKV